MEKLVTLEQLSQRIEKQNAEFSKMTKPQKRVEVAKDLIDRIKLKQLIPQTQRMVVVETDFNDSNSSIKDTLNSCDITICNVCAKGGLFMSYIGRVNKMKFSDIEDDNDVDGVEHKQLLKIFTVRQLALIELVFENDQYLYTDKDGKGLSFDYLKASKFYDKYENEDERLIAIAQNIIDNKGTFKL